MSRKDDYGNEIPKGFKNVINYGLSSILYGISFLIFTQFAFLPINIKNVILICVISLVFQLLSKSLYVQWGGYKWTNSVWCDSRGELIVALVLSVVGTITTLDLL